MPRLKLGVGVAEAEGERRLTFSGLHAAPSSGVLLSAESIGSDCRLHN